MMRNSNSKSNYIYSVVYQLLNVFTPLLTAPYLARVIGAEGVGVFSYFNNISSYFAMVGLLGLTNYGNRYVARVRDNQDELNYTFSSIYYMQIILGVIVSISYALYTVFLVDNNQNYCWIFFLPVLSSIINLTWFYWGLEEFRVTVTRSIIIKLLTIVSIFVFVKSKVDLWKYCLILSAGTFCGNIPLALLLRKYVKLVRVNIKDVIKHIKPNLILFIPILSVSVYRTMDKIMLGWLSTYSEVGYYENADKIINICLGFITALGQVMLPKSANLIANGKIKESNRLIVKSFNFSSLFCSAIVFGIIGVAEVFVPVFFGNDFIPTVKILSLLAPNLFLLAWGNVLKTQVLMPRGKDKAYITATLIGAIVNIIVNLILIPHLKGIGAVIGTISAELVSLIYILFMVRSDFDLMTLSSSVKYIISGIVMMMGVFVAKKYAPITIGGLIFLVICGVLIFIIECMVLVLRKDQLLVEIEGILKNMLRKAKIIK